MAFPIPAKRANETRTTSNVEAELDGEVARASEPYWYEVDLVKPSADVGLGFSIAGGHDVNDQFAYEGIFVTRITPGGLAAMNGHIQPGDRLIQVNNMDLGTATHEEAVRMLRNAGTRVHLVLCRPPPPSDHDGSSIDKLARKNRGFLSPSSTLSSAGPPSPTEVPRQPTARYRKR
uniref:Disks large homolog 2 n=1 Tax=Schistocephalus solidus TaxID=70667 RepID=A0A0V0J6J7_SCHSO